MPDPRFPIPAGGSGGFAIAGRRYRAPRRGRAAGTDPWTTGVRRAQAVGDGDQTLPAPDPRAAVLLPPQLLQPTEIVILLLKPSPWYIVLESLRSLAALAVIAVVLLYLNTRGLAFLGRGDIALLFVGLAGARLCWQFLEWLSRVYVLTDRRVIRVYGVLRVQVFEAQLKHIQHTTIHMSPRERVLGLGTIGFTTAGMALTEAYWRMVARPLEVHQTVVQAINRYK